MTKALAVIPPSPPTKPEMPPELAQRVAAFDGMDIIRGAIPIHVIAQANAHLAALERFHVQAPPALMEVWCRKVRNGTAVIDEREFLGRLEAIQDVCGDLPAWVWTQESLKLAWRHFKFFPTSSELFDMLNEIAQRGLAGTAHVRLLANAKIPQAPQGDPATPEQIAEMRAAFGIRDVD